MKLPLIEPYNDSLQMERIGCTAVVIGLLIAGLGLVAVAVLIPDGLCLSVLLFQGLWLPTFAILFWRRTTYNIELTKFDSILGRRGARIFWLLIGLVSLGFAFYFIVIERAASR